MKLGLMGGTFDPPHRGHLRVAEAALGRGLERVDFVPARRPPHKQRADMTGPFHRFAMAALATSDRPGLGVSAYEISRDAPSYTIETVRHYAGLGHAVTLIMGSDSLADIETWRECHELLGLARVLVYPRRPAVAGALEARLPAWVRARMAPGSGTIEVMDEPADDVSSTTLRERVRQGQDITGMTPASVEDYIRKQHLYGDSPREACD